MLTVVLWIGGEVNGAAVGAALSFIIAESVTPLAYNMPPPPPTFG